MNEMLSNLLLLALLLGSFTGLARWVRRDALATRITSAPDTDTVAPPTAAPQPRRPRAALVGVRLT